MEDELQQPELSAQAQTPAPEQSGDQQMRKTPAGKTGFLWIAAVILMVILAAAGCFFLFFVNRFSLAVIPEGEQELILEYGQPYEDPGAGVVLQGSQVPRKGFRPGNTEIRTHSDVQPDRVGKYTVTYQAEFLWWQASASRTVRVVDTESPVITLKDTSGKTILPGQRYEEEGYSAFDNYDGDITDKVVRTEEMGVINYVVVDSSGNPASVQRQIPYYDPLPPEIILEGGESITIPAGTRYEDPGYTASDNADGEITDLVQVEGEVIWYIPGTYTVSYQVEDVYGNVTRKERTVEVTAAARPETVYPQGKVIYLTFDDGPGPYTGRLLDILKRFNVKATFFVMNTGYNTMMQRIVKEGHSIGVHTLNHDYDTIYSSPEAFFDDLYGMQQIIYDNTGVMTSLMRFPGGGSNLISKFNPGIMTTLAQAVQDAGFQYFDWNVDSNDAGGALRTVTVANNVIYNVQNQRISIVLQHDIHDFSVEAVEDIIIWGKNNGYKFLPLTPDSPGMHHSVLN